MINKLYECISTVHSTYDEYNSLIEKCDDINWVNNDYKTSLLHTAISHEKWEIANDLINRGINVNMQDINGNTVLHYIAAKPINIEIAEMILKSGGNPNLENKWSITALFSIVSSPFNDNDHYRNNKYLLMGLMIEYGGDENYRGKKGMTPLELAYDFEDTKAIEILRKGKKQNE